MPAPALNVPLVPMVRPPTVLPTPTVLPRGTLHTNAPLAWPNHGHAFPPHPQPLPATSSGVTAPTSTQFPSQQQWPRFASPASSLPVNAPPTLQTWDPISLRTRLDEFFATLPSPPAPGQYDVALLRLLHTAVMESDLDVLILVQIHSIFSMPELLPAAASGLSVRCKVCLDQLLYSDNSVCPQLRLFVQTFPCPLLVGCSYPDARIATTYRNTVTRVVDFCSLLEKNWGMLLNECRAAMVPPLVDDIVDRLHVTSPLLQTMIFDQLLRVLPIQNEPLISSFRELHHLDRIRFDRLGGRSKEEKAQTYQSLQRLLTDTWRKYVAMVKSDCIRVSNGGAQQPLPPFMVPEGVRSYFASPPLTQLPSVGSQALTASTQRTTLQSAALNTHTPVAVGRPLFPVIAETLPNPKPNTTRTTLHQAHLRSPVATSKEAEAASEELFRFVVDFALPPTPLTVDALQRFSFVTDDFASVPSTGPPEQPGGRKTRDLTAGSTLFRLRCCALIEGTEARFPLADTVWPPDLFIELDGSVLEMRLKRNHGRDLPIDITEWCKSREHVLTVAVNRLSNDTHPFQYCIAVERVNVETTENIQWSIPALSESESVERIKRSLTKSSSTSDDDDEVRTSSTSFHADSPHSRSVGSHVRPQLYITSSSTRISLVEPHTGSAMATALATPVRGDACRHRECFDLRTFLALRPREPNSGNFVIRGPSLIDKWRCPLCRGDARPPALVVDGFLRAVSAELAARGPPDSEARAIVVFADGSWKPEVENERGRSRAKSPAADNQVAVGKQEIFDSEPTSRAVATAAAKKQGVVQVVELD